MITSLSELYFRSRTFIFLVQTKKVIMGISKVLPDTYNEGYIHLFQPEHTHKIH